MFIALMIIKVLRAGRSHRSAKRLSLGGRKTRMLRSASPSCVERMENRNPLASLSPRKWRAYACLMSCFVVYWISSTLSSASCSCLKSAMVGSAEFRIKVMPPGLSHLSSHGVSEGGSTVHVSDNGRVRKIVAMSQTTVVCRMSGVAGQASTSNNINKIYITVTQKSQDK